MAEEGERGEDEEVGGCCFWISLGTIFLSFFSAHSGGSSSIPCKCDVAQAGRARGRCQLRGTHLAGGGGRLSKSPQGDHRKNEGGFVDQVYTPCVRALIAKSADVSVCVSEFVYIYFI